MRCLSSLPLLGLSDSCESPHFLLSSTAFIVSAHRSCRNRHEIPQIPCAATTKTAPRSHITTWACDIVARQAPHELSASSFSVHSQVRSRRWNSCKRSRGSPLGRPYSVSTIAAHRNNNGRCAAVTTGETSPPEHQRQLDNGQYEKVSTRRTVGSARSDINSTSRHDNNARKDRRVEEADRMFELGRALHLRRHRSSIARRAALTLFRHAMHLRPDWVGTDSRFVVDAGINDVFAAFACNEDGTKRSVDERGKLEVGQGIQIDRDTLYAVRSLRVRLDDIGYNAFSVQERFGGGVASGQRLPGPYYLRKSMDHTQAKIIASLGPLRDSLDVAIRLWLLGLALPRKDVERFLGLESVTAADNLGMLGESPVDPSLVVALVQIFPLDADVMSPLPTLEEVAVTETNSIASASNLLFATDWPPPGSTALTEEPVMYIGPDSIGLVQHAPRRVPPSRYSPRDRPNVGGGLNNSPGQKLGTTGSDTTFGRGGMPDQRGVQQEEHILDLCCGSGIQGIAAAVLRSGNASVTCVDINPRAVRFSRFNAYLNGLDPSKFAAIVGDLYSASVGLDPTRANCSENRVAGSTSLDSKWIRAAATGFDLILVNPPFVPVPPKMDSTKRRYDLFASGGSTGEDILRGIFRGALDHLRAAGILAVVSELANPTTYDIKLRHWVRRQTDDRGASRTVSEGDATFDSGRSGTRSTPTSRHTAEPCHDAEPFHDASGHGVLSGAAFGSGDSEDNETDRHSGDQQYRELGSCIDRWAGLVFYEKQPWSASEYAARRAGSKREAEGWVNHFDHIGIDSMAAGFVFVRKISRESIAESGGEEKARELESGGSANSATYGKVEIQGIEKIWAPHNRAAVDATKRALNTL